MRKKCVRARRCALLCVVCPGLFWAASGPRSEAALANFVVVGDSLAAGFQNFSLLDKLQTNGFAYLIASQAGKPLEAPLIPCPGIGPDLELFGADPTTSLPIIGPIAPPLPGPARDNPGVLATNLAVPGQTVAETLNKVPGSTGSSPAVNELTDAVLGFPSGQQLSQAQLAVQLNPTTILVWTGNNDVLLPAITGDFSRLTPVSSFAASYTQLLRTLAGTRANLVTANIPDVTSIPFFTPVTAIAQQAGIPADALAAAFGVGAGDYLRPCALPLAYQTLGQLQAGQQPTPLPATCSTGLAGLSNGPLPTVLTATQALTVRTYTDAFNTIIAADAAVFRAVLVDAHRLVQQLHSSGYNLNGTVLTTAFLGGLFSLDGVHPSNTGHAILANAFIDAMNANLGLEIPRVSVGSVAAADPLLNGMRAQGFNACSN